jgi:hypothetical protein
MYGATGGGSKIPSGYRAGRIQQFTPQQMQLFQSLFSHLGPESYLSKLAGGDEQTFAQMEAPAMRQFAGLQGNLASRFSGMGMGGRRSSGFQNTATQAGSDFAQELQSRRQGLQRQALQDLIGMSNTLLGQKPYEQFLTPEKPSFLQSILGALGQGTGQFAGTMGGGFGMKNLFGG